MDVAATLDPLGTPQLSRAHARRLRAYYRSAGWPCLDAIEIDLLQLGLIERVRGTGASETLRVTDSGMHALALGLSRNRGAFDAHEAAVRDVALQLAMSGRLVYRNLALRGAVSDATGQHWRLCKPDVYSLRHTTVADYACPVIHEIKVRRADLLGDIANADKRASYMALSCEFYYVVPEGLARLDEIPFDCGVLFATSSGLRLGRPSPRRNVLPGIGVWMALARRAAEPIDPDAVQRSLRDPAAPHDAPD